MAVRAKRLWGTILCAVFLVLLCGMSVVSVSAEVDSAEWIKADTVLNVGDSLLNESDSWQAAGGTASISEGTVSYPTADLVTISNQTPNTDITYSFKMKLVAPTPTNWLAYIGFRTNEYSARP